MRTALVIGAGIMGLSAAHALARAGWRVRVLDQDEVPNPRGASHDQHRLIRHAYGAERGYLAMVDAAFAAWGRLWAELGAAHYVPTGVLATAERRGGWLAASRAALTAHGLPPEDLAPAALPARFPMLAATGLAAAFHSAPGGVLLADRILAALHTRCLALGVGFERRQLRALDPARPEADLMVVAAGAWVGRLSLGLADRVAPSRQVVVYLEPPPELRAAWAAAPMLLDLAEEGGFYAVPPVAGTALKLGNHRFSLRGDAEDTRVALPAEAEAILALARRRLPGLERYRVLEARACYYAVAAGERFILRPLGPRAWVMAGFSGHGFKFGPLLGQALARAVADPALAAGLPAWAAGLAPAPEGLLTPPA